MIDALEFHEADADLQVHSYKDTCTALLTTHTTNTLIKNRIMERPPISGNCDRLHPQHISMTLVESSVLLVSLIYSRVVHVDSVVIPNVILHEPECHTHADTHALMARGIRVGVRHPELTIGGSNEAAIATPTRLLPPPAWTARATPTPEGTAQAQTEEWL